MTGPGSSGPVCLGPVGFGLGGRMLHAPFIEAADGIEIVGEVTRWGAEFTWSRTSRSRRRPRRPAAEPAGEERVRSEAGRYQDYYTQFAAACRGQGELPVTSEQGVATIAVLDAARRSAETGRAVALD